MVPSNSLQSLSKRDGLWWEERRVLGVVWYVNRDLSFEED